MDLSERATCQPVVRVSRRWWEQDSIDLERAKKQAAETTTVSESESEEEADVVSNKELGGEEESQRAIGLSGWEWSGSTSNPPRHMTGRKHCRGGTT